MDRYERLMLDILNKTVSHVLRWKVAPSQSVTGLLPSIEGVKRIFVASYPLGDQDYTLFFVEAKSKRIGDFGAISEVYNCEIYIVNQAKEVALILYDGLAERDDLLRLSGLIAAYNDQTEEFFEAFDRSGAA